MEPQVIVSELQELIETGRKGSEALYEAETNLAQRELELDKTEAAAFLDAEGNVAERQALAKLTAAEARFERDIARAQVNRVRAKIKSIEAELMAQATIAKMVQAEMKL
jgi:hypothetical protein